ncbi:hypothetical protein O0L34_g7 [Tuta absoluta]|nr:hypothetical protein O0L34_g7 [Tuta absoluta]
MVSDFRKKKLLHVFQAFFDTDKSGSIEKTDFEQAAANIAKFRGWSGAEAKEAQDTLMKIWDELTKADVNSDGKVSADEWIALCDDYAKNPDAHKWQNLYMKFIFDLEDASRDGSIDKDEFSTVYSSFGLNKDESVSAFQKMGKGKANVTWDEFQALWKEYFASDDASAPGNFIFGKTSF